MKQLFLLACFLFTLVTFCSPMSYGDFSYDIDSFTQVSGSSTFVDEFDDGLEPPSGPSGPSTYDITSPLSSTAEGGGSLNLHSDDAALFSGVFNFISSFLKDNTYFFNSGSGGSVEGRFRFTSGIETNSGFEITIFATELIVNPSPFEVVLLEVAKNSSGRIIATLSLELPDGETDIGSVDITDSLTGKNSITMRLDISTGNVVTASLDFGSDGTFDLTIPGSHTLSFSPGLSYTGSFGAGETFCNYSISPTSQSFSSDGGSGSVNVLTPVCDWTATSNVPWITITSGSSGTGDGTVDYSVSSNTNAISRTGAITIEGEAFTVTQAGTNLVISPSKGGNTGQVTVTMFGHDFVEGTTAKLVKDAQEIIGINTIIVDSTQMITTFDLVGKELGKWDVVVTNPDSTSITVPDGFTIEEGKVVDIWVDIIGRDVISVGREQTFNIFYGNRGNVDAMGVFLWIGGIPKDATWELKSKITPSPPPLESEEQIDWSGLPVHIETEEEIIIPLFIPRITPGFNGNLVLNTSIHSLDSFQLRAWVNKPIESSIISAIGDERISSAGRSCIGAITETSLKLALGALPGGKCVASAIGHVTPFINFLIDGLFSKVRSTREVSFSAIQILSSMAKMGVDCAGEAVPIVKVVDAVATVVTNIGLLSSCKDFLVKQWISPHNVTVVTSIDPNDKVGPVGFGAERYLLPGIPFNYVIHFENMEAATAPAQEVVVTDQLDIANFDLDTFSFGTISFGRHEVTVPVRDKTFTTTVDLRPEKNLLVDIQAGLNITTGLLTWHLKSIDPDTGELPEDPMAGFLPPNMTSPEGEGSVMFTVMPKEGIVRGTEVRNKAKIVFDLNAPIETNEWFNTIGGDVIPNIQANGSDEPMTVSQGNLLGVTASLDPVGHNGENADWWVAAASPFGLYWFTLDTRWVRSDTPIRVYGGLLFNLSPFTVLEMSTLPVGTYTFYFGVDMIMNGTLDLNPGQLYYDSVVVNITP